MSEICKNQFLKSNILQIFIKKMFIQSGMYQMKEVIPDYN